MSSLSFSSDLVGGVQARLSVKVRNEGGSPRRKKKKKCLFGAYPISAFRHTGGHLLYVLLDRPMKKRDCYCRELILYEVESGPHYVQCMQVLLLFFEREL